MKGINVDWQLLRLLSKFLRLLLHEASAGRKARKAQERGDSFIDGVKNRLPNIDPLFKQIEMKPKRNAS